MSAFALPGPLWLIGCGNMAGAMLEGWLARGLDPSRVTVVRPSGRQVALGVRVLTTLPEDEVPAIAVLGIKPHMLDEVAPSLRSALDPATILLSVLAGVEQGSLRARFPASAVIVRAMPNLPVKLNKGAIGLFSDSGDAEALRRVSALMTELGAVEWIADERLFDLVTALSGSGPAFLFRFIDALAQAAAGLGMPQDQAERLALATVDGASAMVMAAAERPSQLANRVASAGGSTRKGLDVLDADQRLVSLLSETLGASVRRNREMAAEARGA